ncbi:cocaine esterase-like [Centroberyx affinis]|uniref:cocaine esterase-like n=1 Tax=Centroberyx affinis TaxID=166261 RepID=UPI003A5C3A4F
MKPPAHQTPVFLTLSILFLCVAADLHGPVVHTKLGGVRGQYVSVKGKETGVHAYVGVPFAKPPAGSLRLAPPQPAEGWEGVRDATQQPPICVQNKQLLVNLLKLLGGMIAEVPDVSEDCLYLNIYTPANAAPDANLPVMVWIHGGGLTSGSASIYDGSALAAYQDMVVVLIQYRLGLLGFLSTGDEHMSGNFGLLDQVEALRWIQEHIHNFGGDPGSVTIFGESAGGTSVSLLLLSLLSDGLFHHAIAESGTAAMDQLVTNDPLPVAQMIANVSGCGITSTEKIADCMRHMDNDAMVTLGQDQMMRFPVSVDGHFLTKPVAELFQNHELLKIPFITGINNDEVGWLLPGFFAPPNWTEGMDREDVTSTLAMFFPDPKDELIRELIADEYLGTSEDRVKNRDGFTELLGDLMFTFPAIKVANAHRDAGAPVYLYEYQYAPKYLQEKRPSFVGSDHGDELLTVLGFCFTTTHVKIEDVCTEEEEQLSRTMMNYWGSFARTGSPNGDGLVHWPQYGAEGDYLAIGMEQVPGQHLKKDRFTFITQTLPEKIRQHQEKMEHGEL